MKSIIKHKKKIFIASAIIVLIAMLSTLIVKHVDNKQANLNPEILRSMNYAQVTDDGKVENTDFVKFSAFFTRDLNGDGNAEKILGTCRNVNSTDQLYIDLNVLTNGYLKDGVITINSTNFNYSMNMVKDSVLKNNYISDDVKVIELNQVNAGTQKLIIGDVLAYIGDNINNYSNISSITLTGTHVSDEGVETPISKTVDLTVDWHGETRAIMWHPLTFYYNYDELESTTVSFSVKLEEDKKELILKENVITVTIPELNGYAPVEVKCINDNVQSQYDGETKKLTIRRTSEINEDGAITRTISRSNTYNVNVTYPQEAYDEISSYTTLTIPMEGYYTGYNNTNDEFKNPYISNVVKENLKLIFREKPKGAIYDFYVDFMDKKYVKTPNHRYVISKQEILNLYNTYSEENVEEIPNKEYIVRWQAIRGSEGEVPSMTMSETKSSGSSYGDKWDNTILEEYITNTGIYFTGADNMLEEDGTINVYNNDTNELIHTFTKQEWNKYTRENPYKYDVAVRHIRVETSKAKLNSNLSVYNVKELEVKKILQDFKKEDIENIDLVYTYLTGTCNIEGQSSSTINDMDNAYYVSDKSNSKISVRTQELLTQEELRDQEIYIDAIYKQEGDSKWKNGEFLVELPEDIINIQINKISINKSSVKIVAYDVYQKDGKYFVKIITENEEPTDYRITINCNLVPDPRSASASEKIKLYSYNQYCNDYYYEMEDIYDVNSNNNTEEKVGNSETTINLLSPTSLVTLEILSNYNQKNEITVAPNVAEIEKDTRQATVNISLTNNYPNTVSGVQILGKIPFEGNKYVLNGKDLGSKFTTTMTKEGITIPEELQEKVVIYYSEKEEPNKNLEDAENGWTLKENVQDFSKIKTYLIDLKEYTIQVGKDYTFNYVVNIPENIKNNLASYSNHAVYYELNTPEGNLQLSTEPNKVGIKVVRKFGLDLAKYKKGSNTLKVAGATYTIEYEDIEEFENIEEYPDIEYDVITRILTTDSSGTASLDNLYVDNLYKLRELKSPDNYKLSNEIIEFKVIEDEQGNLQLETNSRRVLLDKEAERVQINTEDEPKYNITITKKDSKTEEALSNILFKLNGKVYTTDRNGKITIERLEQNTEYTLKEVKATGYYILEDIIFKLVEDDNGNLQIESNNGEFLNGVITNNDDEDLIQIDINLENEKIPTYELQILKVAENFREEDIDKLTPLSDAKFNLRYTDINTERYYTTDENGIVNIQDLYQYVDGKYITGEYVLQELQAPAGYANNAEEIRFRVSKDEEGKLEAHIENKENLVTIRDIQVEENTVKIIIQDKPLFKLFKTDSKTGEPLAGVQFVIYEVDDNKSDIDYAKDVNENYVGEINEDGQYVVTTDETGTIVLPLKNGSYRAVEIGYPEGYYENANEQYFKVADEEEEEKTEEIEINSIEDLVELSNAVNEGNSYKDITIKLMKTLDFEDSSSYERPENKSYGDLNGDGIVEGIKLELTNKVNGCGFTPIGTNFYKCFSGIFDGQNNEIRNLYIKKKVCNGNYAYAGLFGVVNDGEIKNVGVTGKVSSNVGEVRYLGGISGYVVNGRIYNSYNEVEVSNNGQNRYTYIGGIVGYINGNMSRIHNTGEVVSSNYTDCSYAGGIAGYLCGNIREGSNKGSITNTSYYDNYAGGIIGYANGNISNVSNTGEVSSNSVNSSSGHSYTGGIVGYLNGSINNSYNTRRVNSKNNYCNFNNIGGIAGEVSGSNISNSYNIGEVDCTISTSKYNYSKSGGIVGDISNSNISNCYYLQDIIITGASINTEGKSQSDNYMKTENFVKDLGEDHWNIDSNYENNGYPILKEQYENIETKYIYNIKYIEDLLNLSKNVNDGNTYSGKTIILERTLDFADNISYKNPEDKSYGDLNGDGTIEGIKAELTDKEDGHGFTPIGLNGDSAFSGIFNGQGNEIRNLYVNIESGYIGLFGYVRNGKIENIGVTGELTGNGGYAGGVAGNVNNSIISNCYNLGDISLKVADSINIQIGGIAGAVDQSIINNCYNSGEVKISTKRGWFYYVGGVAGYVYSVSSINNCYNTGEISTDGEYSGNTGGIAGYVSYSSISNCYNIAQINLNANYNSASGEIHGGNNGSSISNNYYLDSIYITSESICTEGIPVSSDYMKTQEFYNQLNADNVWLFRKDSYPKLNVGIPVKVQESTEINIENNMKKFDITTEIAPNSENERAGGTITGEHTYRYLQKDNIKFVETINYNCDNIEEIIISPDEGYLIYKITINGEELDFEADEEGNYKIPVGYFEKVKQNYHIVVRFERSNRTLIINKVDSEDKSKGLSGAEFMVEKIDERPAVTNEVRSVVGIGKGTLVTGVLGSLTKNGKYYFTNSNGTYIPNNHYVNSSTANSYIPIDLTNRSGEYIVVVNAEVSSESYFDEGYATITQSTTAPPYYDSTGRVMIISGTVSAKNYEYTLQGGKRYYLHLGYRKDNVNSNGSDKVTINSINVYRGITYNFTQSNGKYMSSNQNKDNTESNSYIPIDLTNRTGKYTLNVNAEVSSQLNCDYGYATITANTSSPEYNNSTGRLIYISGTESAKDYTTILEAGKMYYLHLGYRKDDSESVGSDTFTVNSVRLSLNTDDLYRKEHTTNSYGEIKVVLPYGKYKLTETKAPEGYALDSNPKEIALEETNTSITIENKKQKPFEIAKIDKETNEPIQNTKFAVYRISEDYEVIDFIKNNNGEYIGQKNDDGVYVISTDEDGKIKLSLGPGLYKAVEIESADGYILEEIEELRTTYFKIEDSKASFDTQENNQQANSIETSVTDVNSADVVINNIEDLVRLSNDVNSGNTYEGKTIVLSKTLDFNEDTSYSNPEDMSFGDYNGDGTSEGIKEELTKEASTGFKPIGMNYSFKGTFNGNNNEIKNIYINRSSSSLGLFGKIEDSKIINLGVTGNIGYSAYEMGAIAGGANNSVISNCYNKAKISTTGPYVGGIVGNSNNSTIRDCYSTTEISNSSTGGGIAGVGYYSNIINCYNEGAVTSSYAGGIIGYTSNSTINSCHNTATIRGNGTNSGFSTTGGIVGQMFNSKVKNCYNEGEIFGGAGIIGYNGYGDSCNEITNCRNRGTVNGEGFRSAGGITGGPLYNSRIDNCYNTGNVTGNSQSAGGIVGNELNNSIMSNCYNTGIISNSSTSSNSMLGGIIGYTVTNSTITNCYNEGDINSSNSVLAGGIACVMSDSKVEKCYNMGAINSVNCPAGGVIYSASNSLIVNCYNSGAVNVGSAPAGGLVYTISNSEITNCYNDGDISGKYGAGGISNNISNTKVVNCYNTGNINGNSSPAGGIASSISNNSKIWNCCNTGNINSDVPAGGVAQYISNSEVINFYNTGTITGNYGTGGVVQSLSNSIIKRCYYLDSSAPQGIYNEQDIEQQVEAKTDAEMKSDEFAKLLNVNRNIIDSENMLYSWKHNENSYPTLNKMEPYEGEALTITNRKEGANLVIKKVDKNTKQQLSGAKFKIVNDSTTIELETNEEGIADTIVPIGEYIITEITAPAGYKLSNEKKKVLVESLSGVTQVTFEDEAFLDTASRYNFILTKRDEMTNEIMPGVKFTILDEEGNYAKDYTGANVGQKEQINGEEKFVVTTDENGQVKLKLSIGKYKLIEVQTLEGYALEGETEFEITDTSDNKELSWEGITIGSTYPYKDYIRATNDGGSIALVPSINNSTIQDNTIPAEYMANNQPMQIESKDSIVKYNNKGKIEKILQINGLDEANSVYEDTDGNYVISGQAGTLEILAENTVNGVPITVQNDSTYYQMVTIKLNNELKVIWAKTISGICPSWTSSTYIGENKAGNYLVGANISTIDSNKNVIIPAEDTNNDQGIDITLANSYGNVLLEYTKEGKVVSFKQVPINIEGLIEKEDGGYTVVSSSKAYELDSEMNLVKESSYDFTGITINSYWVTNDEGYIAGGILSTNSATISGEYTSDGNDIAISSQMAPDTILIKYNKDFKIEWVQVNSFENSGLSEINQAVKQDVNGNYYSIVSISTSPHTYKLVKYDMDGKILNIVNIDSNNIYNNSHMYSNNNNTQYIIVDSNKQMYYNLEQTDFTALELTVTNKRVGKVIVHHYLEGTGSEYGTDPITFEEAPDEELVGKFGDEYTSTPHMDIPGHALIKDESGEYIIPENASGEFTEKVQHVYYYYSKNKVNLTVHHYIEGTENKVPLGRNEQGEDIFAEDEISFYNEGEHYKTTPSEEVLKSYELVSVVGDEEKDITQDEVVTYYYKIKKHEITTRVEIPEDELGTRGTEKGGSISGEGQTPYETVDYGKSSVEDIVVKPDDGYRIKQIRLVSTNEDGSTQESIIYVDGSESEKEETENAEITYMQNEDGSLTLTKFENMTEDKEVIVIFEKDEGRLIVHHYIEGTTEKIYDDQITIKSVGTKVETSPVKVGNYVLVEEPEDRNATITREVQEKTYYYQEQYKITTDIIEHSEKYKDGTVKQNVKGGTITDEDKDSHENVLKNRNSKDIIEIAPDEGYEIVKITINGKYYNFKDTIDESGKVTLPEGFFQSMQEDKHIEVEFRRKTKVIVKYLEEPQRTENEDGEDVEIDPTTAKVVAEKVIINGYEGQDFETIKKVIPNYQDSGLGITDEKVESISPDGTMYADTLTIIYWYTRVPSGIIVRHIETNEKAEEIEIESKLVDGLAGLEQPTTRNKYNKYIPVDRKEENKDDTDENVTIMPKDQDAKTLTFAEDKVLEVWYFYEKQYDVTTEVKPHEESIANPETGEIETIQVAGGTISKKYEKDEQGNDKLDENGNKIEAVYEKILSRGDSKEEIEIKPDSGYRIKAVTKQKKVVVDGKETYEEEQVFIENMIKEDGSLVLGGSSEGGDPEGGNPEESNQSYLTDVQNDYNIVVEFERIPAKVIVQYKDSYTKESIIEDKIVDGYVNDEYSESRLDIESYIPADPEPTNSEGTMTEEIITITYWYTKQFKITAEVTPHEEEEQNPQTGEIIKVQKDGGTIKIGDDLPEEIVTRGGDSTQKIIATPEEHYRIKTLTINGKQIEISELLKEDGSLELPLFENMQEDKHIEVEFERIPAKVIVKYLDVETRESIVDDEIIGGYVTKDYETEPKDLKYYEFVEEKYPKNDKGTMTEEDITVKYYYRKLKFNMKIEKEIQSIKVNGQEAGIDLQNNKYAKLKVEYSEIEDTNIEIGYKIKVTNTEKLAGTATIEEQVPGEFKFVRKESDENWLSRSEFEEKAVGNYAESEKDNWTSEDETVYMLKTKELQPGETAEYKITLRWKAGKINKGDKVNIAKITNAENEANYEETTLDDNEDKATVEITVNRTIQDLIDDIKNGKTDDIILGIKTGDVIIIFAILIITAGITMIVAIKVRSLNIKKESTKIRLVKKDKHKK